MLPVRILPLKSEALSSWITRLSAAYAMAPQVFASAVFGREVTFSELQAFDLDAPERIFRMLAGATGLAETRVRQASLAGYMPPNTAGMQGGYELYLLKEGVFANARYPTFKSVLVARPWACTDLIFDGRTSCVSCLESDREPYRRIFWRAGWMASCPIHQEMLVPARQVGGRILFEEQLRITAPLVLSSLDELTYKALTCRSVTLGSGHLVEVSQWLRFLRTLLEEVIGGPVKRSVSGRNLLRRAWSPYEHAKSGIKGKIYEQLSRAQRYSCLTVSARALHELLSDKGGRYDEMLNRCLTPCKGDQDRSA